MGPKIRAAPTASHCEHLWDVVGMARAAGPFRLLALRATSGGAPKVARKSMW